MEGLDSLAKVLASAIGAGGIWTSIIAGLIVGLGLLVIVISKMTGVVAGSRGDAQGAELQTRLLAVVTSLTESEEKLRARVNTLQSENGSLHDEIIELRTGIALLRNQRRKLLEIMREIKTDKLGPAAIHAAAIEVTA